jgi:CheY-like chemotaxis protein
VEFDEYCLTHALMNLMQNAIKFTPKGSIVVRQSRDEASCLCIDVHDTGIGIDVSYLPQIFEPFSQEDSGYSRRFEGSGLGLTLTKEYLGRNGARITVESQKGKGSLFRIHLPKTAELAETAPAPETPVREAPTTEESDRRPRSERATILVVEDDVDTQIYMKELLGKRYRVLVAATGDEARTRLEASHGRVLMILMDLSLRGNEDGLMLTSYLRRHPVWRHIPIIATTAHAFPEDRARALEAGCDAYLAKPIRRNELLALMEELLHPSAPGSPTAPLH